MEIEAAVQAMVEQIEARGWLGEKMRGWVIAEGTRQLGLALDEPLKFRMACRVLVRKGITLDDLARRAS